MILYPKAIHILAITHVTHHQNLYTPFMCTAVTLYVEKTEKLIYSDHDNITW